MKFSFKKLSAEKVLLFLLLFGLFIIIPINLYLFSQRQQEEAPPVQPVSSIQQSTISPQPTPTNAPQDSSDIKANILSTIPHGESGILHESSLVRIDYVHTADVFQAEILTADIEQAKRETVLWFMSKGVDQKEICSLPIQFYPNFEVKTALKELKKPFNPLPPGC